MLYRLVLNEKRVFQFSLFSCCVILRLTIKISSVRLQHEQCFPITSLKAIGIRFDESDTLQQILSEVSTPPI